MGNSSSRKYDLYIQADHMYVYISRVSCQKGPTRHAYAWQIGPFWQDTLDLSFSQTAYMTLLEFGQLKEGDTVIVTAAAGAVGSMIGQIARIKVSL